VLTRRNNLTRPANSRKRSNAMSAKGKKTKLRCETDKLSSGKVEVLPLYNGL